MTPTWTDQAPIYQQLADQLAQADMVICTAQVPGRPAPRLIDDAMLARSTLRRTSSGR